jgi:ferredoxin-NADP reductase/nitrite reductase/ring-hydroxylating ferredoxin subunit
MNHLSSPSPLSPAILSPAWHPIAAAADLPFRHVFHGKLLGRELAVWRADDGHVNVWDNRCLHRGVRLSIGMNDGAELKCQYHGWRYASRSAGCTYIPAHPANSPSRQVTNRVFPAIERHGLIWAALEPDQPFAGLPAGDWFAARDVIFHAPAERVLQAVAEEAAPSSLAWLSPYAMRLALRAAPEETLIILAQPADGGTTIIRALRDRAPSDAKTWLRQINRIFVTMRDAIEAGAPAGADLAEPDFSPLPAELAEPAAPAPAGLTVTVARKWQVAADVFALNLRPLAGILPAFQPGAHIDVTLPDGTVRQYSLTGGPDENEFWTIGVRLMPNSRGGSRMIAEQVREGDLLSLSAPRHNFPLRRDALRSVLIAGGIGLTPLLAMAKALRHGGHPFELHVFARDQAHLPFAETLRGFGESVRTYLGQDRTQTQQAIKNLLGPHGVSQHVYVCGAPGLIDAVTRTATGLGWPDEAVHYEHFSNDRTIDSSSSFTLELARSALTVEVPAGCSMLSAIRQAGVSLPSSCERGACGTCVVKVLEGVPDHQDVYLNATEKLSGRSVVTCVSRANSQRLVLDL